MYAGKIFLDTFLDRQHQIYKKAWHSLYNIKYIDEIEAHYDAAIYSIDQQINRIITYLEEINELKQSLIIISGDHGDNFFYGNKFRMVGNRLW